MMERKGVILHIYGRVQGVGFRYYTNKKAIELGISGFVRNLPDGSVYIEADGEPDQLEIFINWCYEGPSWARVTDVQRQYTPPNGFDNFVTR